MVIIAHHHKKLAAPYRRAPNAEKVIQSAKTIAKLILASDELILPHKKKIISEVLWLLSAADGKYATRFRSQKVVWLAANEPQSNVCIQHEHVYPRASVTKKLLDNIDFYRKNADELELLLDETIGCVVTADEHVSLLPGFGWERYANVPVYDMSFSSPKPLETRLPSSAPM